jgi:hypothetical protein
MQCSNSLQEKRRCCESCRWLGREFRRFRRGCSAARRPARSSAGSRRHRRQTRGCPGFLEIASPTSTIGILRESASVLPDAWARQSGRGDAQASIEAVYSIGWSGSALQASINQGIQASGKQRTRTTINTINPFWLSPKNISFPLAIVSLWWVDGFLHLSYLILHGLGPCRQIRIGADLKKFGMRSFQFEKGTKLIGQPTNRQVS